MSNSRRKTPVFGICVCQSEKDDKKRWHRRWRSTERMALGNATPEGLGAHLPVLEKQVSDVWSMGKDGHIYRSLQSQAAAAESRASRLGRTPQERAALKKRLLKKWMSK
ncbi:hypothetical protein ACO0LF_27150 [Undibacterium sp. Di27W]|uniref:hypothetical protein n=1 Tax=Undibacterium sp. Di27W TaxID=3413036 RepID=UPI003BF1ED10